MPGRRVSPYTGEWIEIAEAVQDNQGETVSPYTGEWIEILPCRNAPHPLNVSPYTGEWIEILLSRFRDCQTKSLSLHRRVD